MVRTVAFGPRLRKLREKHGVTLRDLAEVCGIDFTLINKYENGHRDLSEETFWQLRDGIDKVREREEEEKRDRQALAQLFEQGQIDRDTRAALINRFFADPSFRSVYVDEYHKFGALHPDRHLTREQAEAIRARAGERMERNARWIESLEKAQSQVNDPVLSEIILSFRNEIAELEERNAELRRRIAEGAED
jgi:transcriptional regulator with XRE-family HTH domain